MQGKEGWIWKLDVRIIEGNKGVFEELYEMKLGRYFALNMD